MFLRNYCEPRKKYNLGGHIFEGYFDSYFDEVHGPFAEERHLRYLPVNRVGVLFGSREDLPQFKEKSLTPAY